MNEESLSALLDGECSPAELDSLLRELDHDPALRQRLSRLRLAQEAVRGAPIRAVDPDFAARVMAALPDRPETAAVTPLRRPGGLRWQAFAGLAAAAGVAALAVLALRPESPLAPAAAPEPVAALGAAAAVDSLNDEQLRAQQLRNYLMAYSQSRAQHGVGGSLGYARYAAYAADRTPAADR